MEEVIFTVQWELETTECSQWVETIFISQKQLYSPGISISIQLLFLLERIFTDEKMKGKDDFDHVTLCM